MDISGLTGFNAFTHAAAVDPNAPVAPTFYLTLDETGTGSRFDNSGNTQTFTNNGGVNSTGGKIGNCSTFLRSSSQYLHRASETLLQTGSNSFSIAGWIWAEDQFVQAAIANKGTEFSLDFNVDGAPRFNVSGGSSVVHGTSPLADTWYFLTATYTTGSRAMSVRLNAGAAVTGTAPSEPTAAASDFRIGRVAGAGTDYWNGRMDEFAWFKGTALTADNITYLYNGGSGRTWTGSAWV